MNTQLVNAIIQVVWVLPADEQAFIIEALNQSFDKPIHKTTAEAIATKTQATSPSPPPADDDAWEVWQSLGDDAVPGNLENASTQHDRYCLGE